MSLASDSTRTLIRQLCERNEWQISGKASLWLTSVGVSHETIIQSLIRHIEEGCLIHVKILHSGHSYHGSLLIHPDDPETVYFEIKKKGDRLQLSGLWIQVHPHDAGYPTLPRK